MMMMMGIIMTLLPLPYLIITVHTHKGDRVLVSTSATNIEKSDFGVYYVSATLDR